jgi:hypothetical protein
MDAFPEPRELTLHQQRIRQSQIRDKLRSLSRHIPLPVDSFYERGEFSEQQWGDMHLFRVDQVLLTGAEASGHVRKRAPDMKSSKDGFRMPGAPMWIGRALACREKMTPAHFRVARIIVGLASGDYEWPQVVNAAWEVGQIYRGEVGTVRWRDR